MNEEQSEELINVLKEIKEGLKPIKEEEPTKDTLTARLLKSGFFDSLNIVQREYLTQALKDTFCLSFNLIAQRINKRQEKLKKW